MKSNWAINAKFLSGEDSSKRMFITSSLNQSTIAGSVGERSLRIPCGISGVEGVDAGLPND